MFQELNESNKIIKSTTWLSQCLLVNDCGSDSGTTSCLSPSLKKRRSSTSEWNRFPSQWDIWLSYISSSCCKVTECINEKVQKMGCEDQWDFTMMRYASVDLTSLTGSESGVISLRTVMKDWWIWCSWCAILCNDAHKLVDNWKSAVIVFRGPRIFFAHWLSCGFSRISHNSGWRVRSLSITQKRLFSVILLMFLILLVVWNILFIFHNIWDNPSHWLIFSRWLKTTNQQLFGQTLLRIAGIWVWSFLGPPEIGARTPQTGPVLEFSKIACWKINGIWLGTTFANQMVLVCFGYWFHVNRIFKPKPPEENSAISIHIPPFAMILVFWIHHDCLGHQQSPGAEHQMLEALPWGLRHW